MKINKLLLGMLLAALAFNLWVSHKLFLHQKSLQQSIESSTPCSTESPKSDASPIIIEEKKTDLEDKSIHNNEWSKIQDKTKDTIVQVFSHAVEIDITQPQKQPNSRIECGSGFFINSEGYFITNFHVVSNAKAVWIHIPSLGQRIIDVEVVGVCPDPDRDLALLRIPPHDLESIKAELGGINYLPIGDSDAMRRADEVMALGYPLGCKVVKSTTGVISGRERHWIQMSAAINPGSSGGPLLNKKGEVVGVNSAGRPDAQNVGYIIPSKLVSLVLPDMQKENLLRKPFLGVWFQNATPELTASLKNPLPGGCYINYIIKNSALDKAGAQRGDMIYAINNHAIDMYGEMIVPWSEDKISVTDYAGRLAIGEKVTVDIYRNGKPKKLHLTFGNGDLPAIRFIYPGYEPIDYEIGLGMIVMPLTINHIQALGDQNFGLRKYLEMKNQSENALVITHIFPNSQFFRSRTLPVGSVIDEINGVKVKTLAEYRDVIQKSSNQEFLKLVTTDKIIVVLSMKKILNEEIKLAQTFKYPISENMKVVLNQQLPCKIDFSKTNASTTPTTLLT